MPDADAPRAGLDGHEAWLIRDLVAEGRRVLDLQLRAAEEGDDKSEQMMGLAVAAAGGALAILGWLAVSLPPGAAPLTGAWWTPTLAGLALNLLAILSFIDSYIGLLPDRSLGMRTGPDPAWLARSAISEDWNAAYVLPTLLKSFHEAATVNAETFAILSARRRLGLYFLAGAVLSYALTILIYLDAVGGSP